MAEVYLAREPLAGGLSKTLVIKKIHAGLAEAAQFRAMFEDEAKIGVVLNHPNIVQTFSYGQLGRTYYLAMERVEGIDLLRLIHAVVAAGRKVPPGLAAYVVQQVAKGLDYAHRKSDDLGEPLGIVHRDVSPQNILVSFDGAVKIVDFGIARMRGQKDEAGVVKGKFAYMSPEQASGRAVDRRSDIFSSGIVLYELATGLALYGRMGERQALDAIRNAIVPRPREVDPSMPEELERIILQCLQRRAEDRFQTARDLHNALGRFFFQLGSEEGTLYESGSLAQLIAQVVPQAERARICSLAPEELAPAPPPSGTQGARPGTTEVTGAPSAAGAPRITPGTSITEEPLAPDSEPSQAGPSVRERRSVVIVEGVLAGLPALRRQLGEARARDALLDFLRVAEHVAYKFHAHPDRLDDRGGTWLLGLGVASEDEPSRAVEMGRALIDALDGISRDLRPPLQLAIGVERGLALVGRGGGSFEYEVQNGLSQIARRLAEEAMPGEVLVGGAAHRGARAEWRCEELPSIEIAEPGTESAAARVRVHRVLGGLPRAERMATPRGALVGRELELDALEDAARDVAARGALRTVVVVGERGVGKRGLVGAFLARLDPARHLVLRTVGSAARRDTPYAVAADLARDLLGAPDDADPRSRRRRIDAAVGALLGPEKTRESQNAIDSLSLLLDVKVPGADELDPLERRWRLYQALRLLGGRLARVQTLVIVIEELHLADTESLELFHQLARDNFSRPVLALATVQRGAGDEVDKRLDALIDEPTVTPIFVGELSPRASAELVRARLERPEDPAAAKLVEAIVERAGGNPFFLQETLESLAERGTLRVGEGGRFALVQADAAVELPVSVDAVVASRLDRMPAAERAALRAAAVLGTSFRAADLAALVDEGDAQAALLWLVGRGLLEPGGDGTRGDVFCFKSAVTQEVAYRALAPEVRAQLHRRAAERLCTAPGYRRGADDARVAQHLVAAGDALGAARAWARAGAHARDVSGSAEAFRHFTAALDLLPDSPSTRAERFELHGEREQLLRAWGRRTAQLREVTAMRRIAEELADGRRLAAAHARLSSLYLDAGKHAAARREIGRTLEIARTAQAPVIEAEALRLDAALLMNIGRYGEALERTQAALAALGERADRASLLERAQTLNAVGNAEFDLGRCRDAERAYAEALVIYRRLGTRRLEAAALSNLGNVSIALGEYEEALAHYKRSLKIDQEIGARVGLGATLGNVGQVYAMMGDLDRARRYLGKALALDEASGDLQGLTDATIALGQVHLHLGDSDGAAEHLERGLELAQQTRSRYQEIRALACLAFCKLAGTGEGALDLARSAVKLAREANVAGGEALALTAEATALARAGAAAEAVARSAAAVAILDAGRTVDEAEEVLHVHARMARAAGRPEEARAALARAAAEVRAKAERLRDPEWRAAYLASHPAAAILADARSAGLS